MDARFFFVFFIDFRQMSSYIFYKKYIIHQCLFDHRVDPSINMANKKSI